jgi:Rhodopirellula transposase DDE domain
MCAGISRSSASRYQVVFKSLPLRRSRNSYVWSSTRSSSKIGGSRCTTTSRFLDPLCRWGKECQPISVCVANVELIGNFKNPGQVWKKEAEPVNDHDFRSQASALVSPYGLYEPVRNRGTIVIGTSANTPEFAVDCLDRWILEFGWTTYPGMKEILLLCDSGGSNGYRPRLWKYSLYQTIARVHGLIITVCHYPPGASKWNPVEHRLFSFISLEWAGHPLRSLQLMMSYIEGTTTKTGLQVKAFLNGGQYVKGKTVPDELFKMIPLSRHSELPAWNYTLRPN